MLSSLMSFEWLKGEVNLESSIQTAVSPEALLSLIPTQNDEWWVPCFWSTVLKQWCLIDAKKCCRDVRRALCWSFTNTYSQNSSPTQQRDTGDLVSYLGPDGARQIQVDWRMEVLNWKYWYPPTIIRFPWLTGSLGPYGARQALGCPLSTMCVLRLLKLWFVLMWRVSPHIFSTVFIKWLKVLKSKNCLQKACMVKKKKGTSVPLYKLASLVQ